MEKKLRPEHLHNNRLITISINGFTFSVQASDSVKGNLIAAGDANKIHC